MNEEHLKILEQGVGIWNEWRKKNPDIDPDISGARVYLPEFPGADFRYTDLSDVDFGVAYLIEANFEKANLSRAKLKRACLARACLREANLTDADLSDAILIDVILSRTNLLRTNFCGAHLTGAIFFETALNIATAIWGGAILSDEEKKCVIAALHASWKFHPKK